MQEDAKFIFKDTITYAESAYDALDGADALLLITEWSEFRNPDFQLIKSKMKSPVIFDGRNLYDLDFIEKQGFEYHKIGCAK